MINDPLINSLEQLSPTVTEDTKATLLYQCGIAAAETRFRQQQRRHRWIACLGVFVAMGVGGLVGNWIPRTSQNAVSVEALVKEEPLTLPRSRIERPRAQSTFAVAMSFDKVQEMLRKSGSTNDEVEFEIPLGIETPLSSRSPFSGLEEL